MFVEDFEFMQDKESNDNNNSSNNGKVLEPVKNPDTDYGDITPIDDGDIPF